MVQCYAVVRRADFDQQDVTNEFEAEFENSRDSASASTNSSTSSSSSTDLSRILDITSDARICFKQLFD